MRLIVRIGLAMVVLLVIGAVTLLRALRPPPPLPPAPQGATLGNVTVIEPGLARRAGRTIVVKGGSIESIAAARDAEQNDAYAGMFVLPGLIEMHGHLPPASPLGEGDLFPFLYLFHGVTTVRDLGDVDGTAVAPVRDGLRDGKFAGPRLFACGPFVDGKEALWPNSRIVGNGTEAEAAVRGIADAGFDCVKVYDHLPALGLNAVRAAATARGLPVVGHVPNAVSYAEAGIADVQHFTKAPTFDRADPRPFPELMDAWLALDDTLMDRIVAHALEHGVANTPTLVATERLSRLDAYDELREEPDAQLLPRVYRDVVWRPTEAFTLEILATLRAAVEKEKRLAKRLHDAGARIHVGSDVLASFIVPGGGLHREMRLLVEAGLTPEEALALATRGNGEFLPLEALGRIDPGAPADLVVFREDPTRSLDALETIEAVVADGRLYTREMLDAQLARNRAYFEGAVFDAVSVYLARLAMARVFDDD